MSWHPRDLRRGEGRVTLDRMGAVAEIVLDNPAARNAVSPGMMADLEHVVDELTRWDGVAVAVRGAGQGAFCSGGDLREVVAQLVHHGPSMSTFMAALLDRLAALPCFVLAAVEGPALGGGAEILTACDRVIAGDTARIGFVHASLGVSPGWGGGRRLVERIGPRRATAVLAFSERHSAAEAQDLGLVDEVVAAGQALATAHRQMERLASLPREAVRAAVAIGRSGDRQVELERFAALWGGPAHAAALDARR